MEFRVLGVVEALEHGLPVSLGGPKQKSLLAMLLLDVNHAVSTDRLVDGLWGDEPPQRAAATIHVYVSKLRKAIEPDRTPRAEPTRLLTQAPGYLLAVDSADVDLFRFEELVAVARALWADGCVVGAAVLFREALALWREAPLADLADEPFARFEVARLEESRTGAIEDRIDADLALGRAVELLPELEALVARHPYRERLHRQLMLALYRAGQQADALTAYQRARAALVDDLGLEPGRDLREMESAILVQEPELAWSEPRAITADEAVRVLRAANRAESDETDVATVVDEARTSARRAEDALRRAIDREHTGRLSATVVAAGATQVELDRARRVIVDGVLDRRVRRAPRPVAARVGTTASTAAGACPYKGLLRFEPEDADWYFGRERLVAELLAGVASTRCVGIVGASGSGKSSLTRAGLVAALRDDALPGSAAWPRLLVTPSTDPVLELARALAPVSHAASADHVRGQLLDDPESIGAFASRAVDGRGDGASVMIVVDQLEEVFTVCRDDEVRARFLDVLVHAATDPDAPTRVLAAIRADYYGRCAEHADFADLLGRANVLVGPMRPDEVQRAIEEPARAAGVVLEDGLLERILDDVGTEPGSLPLLETALLETWTRRDGNLLTLDGYEATGGVRGAVAHLADDVYARMSSPEQDITRGIFLRLAEPGVGTDDVRRRAPLDELLVDDEHAHVLGTLVEHRLVVTSDVTAEVAHEALLREWPRLRGWLEEDREGRRVHRSLSIAAQDWVSADRNDDLLFRGTRLAAALDVADAHPAEINPLERDFLGASRAHQDTELRSAQRTAHRLRRLTRALAVLLVIALIAGAFSLVQRSRANDNADRAEQQATIADAQRLAAESRAAAAEDQGLALLLAVEGRRLGPSVATEGALEHALLAVPTGVQRVFDYNARSNWIGGNSRAFGTRVLVPDANGRLQIVDPRDGRVVRRFKGATGGPALGPLLSENGRWVISGSSGGIVNVWKTSSPERFAALEPGGAGAAYGVFDRRDLDRVITAGQDGRIALWDLREPDRQPVELFRVAAAPSTRFPNLLRISVDGRILLAGEATVGPTYIFDRDTGATRVVSGVVGDISLDSSWLVTSTPTGLQRWDATTGAPIGELITGVTQPGPLARISPNGRYVAVGDLPNQSVRVFDLTTGSEAIAPLDAGISVPLPSFLPDGRLIVTGNGRGQIVDIASQGLPPLARALGGHRAAAPTYAADGERVITVEGQDGPSRLWDAEATQVLETVPDPGGVVGRFSELSPDLRHVLAWVPKATEFTVWRRGSARPMLTLPMDPAFVSCRCGWSPSGRTLWVIDADGVHLWQDRNGEFRRTAHLDLLGGPANPDEPYGIGVQFAPGERQVVVAEEKEGTATLYDTASGRQRRVFDVAPDGTITAVAFTPDGRTLIASVAPQDRITGGFVVFDVESGEVRERKDLAAAADWVVAVRGGEAFVTAQLNYQTNVTTLTIWDMATLSPIGDSFSYASPPIALAASGDGRQVVHGSAGDQVVIWDVDPDVWADRACEIAGRTLTRDEWKRYLPGRPYDPACA